MAKYAVDLLPISRTFICQRKGFSFPLTFCWTVLETLKTFCRYRTGKEQDKTQVAVVGDEV